MPRSSLPLIRRWQRTTQRRVLGLFSSALHCPAAKYKKRMEKKEKKAERQKFKVHHSGFLGLYRSKMTRFQRSPRLSSTDARPGPNVGCCSCMHLSEAKVVVFLLGKRQTPRFDRFSNTFAKATPATPATRMLPHHKLLRSFILHFRASLWLKRACWVVRQKPFIDPKDLRPQARRHNERCRLGCPAFGLLWTGRTERPLFGNKKHITV